MPYGCGRRAEGLSPLTVPDEKTRNVLSVILLTQHHANSFAFGERYGFAVIFAFGEFYCSEVISATRVRGE